MQGKLGMAVIVAGVLAAPATSHALAPIEGVWAFQGGQVAIVAQPDGTLLGTVVRPTLFADCVHPSGERMWTSMTRQPDGQYVGGHRWYVINGCAVVPEPGPSAWRLLPQPDGATILRFCVSRPEAPTSQPSIAPDGSSTGVTRGCYDSAKLFPLQPRATFDQVVDLPSVSAASSSRRSCVSRRSFRIRLKEPRGDALKDASVFVNGKRVATRKGKRMTAPVVLRGLPKGRFAVRIRASTVLGHTVTGVRRYRTCTPKPKKTTRPKSRV
jgi:hypothetical protein